MHVCAVPRNWDCTVTAVSYKPGLYATHCGRLSTSGKHTDLIPHGHRGALHLEWPLPHPLPGLSDHPVTNPLVHLVTTDGHLPCAGLGARYRCSSEPGRPPKGPQGRRWARGCGVSCLMVVMATKQQGLGRGQGQERLVREGFLATGVPGRKVPHGGRADAKTRR